MTRRLITTLAIALMFSAGAGAGAQNLPGPTVRPLATFSNGTIAPFYVSAQGSAAASSEHAANSGRSLRLDKGYVVWDGAQDWSGYDFFKANVFSAATEPVQLYVEIHDRATTDYWTRVNYNTVIPPGASTLILPTELYVGEKARPGRPLDKATINVLVLSLGDSKGPVFFDNLRLERDLSDRVHVPGLMAFSFGPANSHPLSGFLPVGPTTLYNAGKGYGLKSPPAVRAYDVLQPDPLYERGMDIYGGGFVVDVPNGKYHVFVNLDNPSGFWGEYQIYRTRSVKANGVEVVHETMDLPVFLKRYFRFADVEDGPDENTFDKYQRSYFHEKEFDVEVTDGHLDLRFDGDGQANSVSALVLYPANQAVEGRKYLDNLRERRRFYFDNYFKRIIPNGSRDGKGLIPPFEPTAAEKALGYTVFVRDWMEDVPVTAVPRREEVTRTLSVFASAGQLEPIVFSIASRRDLGTVTISATDLTSADSSVAASAISMGVVSHRLTRVTSEGSVYTIAPRLIMPRATANLKKGVTTTFWLTLHTPAAVKPGMYRGQIKLSFADGKHEVLALNARLFATPLDPLDVPAGPWGSTIDLPWYAEDLGDYNRKIYEKCLAKMREYGCTTFSGIPSLRIRGWKNAKPDIDFSTADQQMSDARAAGFHSIVVNYNGGIVGFDNYHIDADAMKSAGFTRYADYLGAVLAGVDAHARAANWLPVAYNLCDEPVTKDEVDRAAANAEAWRLAAPAGILTTGATSIENPKPDDPRLPLVKSLKIANLNNHDPESIRAIHAAGNEWAFYNGGSRWTFGTYMFKAAHEYGMKFRLSWHWNASAGDPYYALDCREDDYAWCVTNARMELIPTILFDREIRAGIDDYRAMLTLSRLLKEHPSHPTAGAASRLLEDKLASFKLGEREHNAKWPQGEFRTYRLQLVEAIERFSH